VGGAVEWPGDVLTWQNERSPGLLHQERNSPSGSTARQITCLVQRGGEGSVVVVVVLGGQERQHVKIALSHNNVRYHVMTH
jgi:hypothetical protein